MKNLFLALFLMFGTSLFAMETETNSEEVVTHSAPSVEAEEVDSDDDEMLEEEDEEEELFEKVGFLTTEDCALKGTFTSCYSESYVCNFEWCFEENEAGTVKPVQLVLFVHNDGKYYKVNLGEGLAQSEADKGVGRNEVTVIGKYDEVNNIITASEFQAPPPPKASFFKGCL